MYLAHMRDAHTSRSPLETPLLKLRLARKMSQAKVAKVINATQPYLSRAERGLLRFTPESAELLSDHFGGDITPDQILRPWSYPKYRPRVPKEGGKRA